MKIIISLLIGIVTMSHAESLIVTGRSLNINGRDEIPRPMFGVHATPLSSERVEEWGIESDRYITQVPLKEGVRKKPEELPHVVACQWDRYQPALIVRYEDWKERLVRAAEKAAQSVKDSPRPMVIEFWNEPYLNWGVRPGVNYDGRFYKMDERQEGAPMTLKYADTPLEYMRWTEQTVAIREENGDIDYLASRFMPKGTKPGDTWKWRNIPYRAETRPWGKDITQKTFWPGLQNAEWYNEMLKVYAPAFKKANPEALLIAGWDFHIYQNGYAAWEDIHKPTIDAGIEWIDGYSEHHYGGETRKVAASYEMAHAYIFTEHGKSIQFYNTEVGGDLDPERPGAAQPGYNTTPPEVRDRAAYTYMMRDILHLLDKSPDKAAARAAHEAHHGKGISAAFRMLKPLRGTLMEAVSPREDVWMVSSLEGNRLTVAIFNDSPGEVTLPLQVVAPKGSVLQEGEQHRPGEDMSIQTQPVLESAAVREHKCTVQLDRRESTVFTYTLAGSPTPASVRKLQYPAKEVLKEIPKDGSLEMTISVPRNVLQAATHAQVRVVQTAWNDDRHELKVNGHSLELKPGGIGIVDVEIPLSYLKETNTFSFSRKQKGSEAWIQAVSLYLIQERG